MAISAPVVEDAFRNPVHGVGPADPDAAQFGIEEPDVGHSEGGVVVDAILHPGDGIVLRKDFDTDERRMGDDVLGRKVRRDNGKVGDAETPWMDLDTLLRKDANVPTLAVVVQPPGDFHLKI
jgi:hypothetical protein